MADIKSRMETVRAQFKRAPFESRIEAIRAFDAAAEYFGLKKAFDDLDKEVRAKRGADGWEKRLWRRQGLTSELAHLMAEVLFGKPGRGRQLKDWTDERLLALGRFYFHIKAESKELKDSQIAELLIARNRRKWGNDSEPIRQRLPAAKRAFLEWCTDRDAFDGKDDDVAVLKKLGLIPPDAPLNLVAGPHHGKPFIWFRLD